MSFLSNIDWKKLSLPKLIGMGILVLIFVAIAIWLIAFAISTAFRSNQNVSYYDDYAISPSYAPEAGFAESMENSKLSIRNVLPPLPGRSTGSDAEEFEVTDYYASIRTRKLEESCSAIETLKPRKDVIF